MKTFRRCPKCKSMLNLVKDQYGWFVECISCGFTRDIEHLHAKRYKFNIKGNALTIG